MMKTDSHRRWRITAVLLCLVVAVLCCISSSTPRLVNAFTVIGAAVLALAIWVWDAPKVPVWLMWFLLPVGWAGMSSRDIYKVMEGERHWWELLPLPIILLCAILGKRRESNEA